MDEKPEALGGATGRTEVIDLSKKSSASLNQLLENASHALRENPSDEKARKLRDDLLTEWSRRHQAVHDGWTPGNQGDPRLLKANGKVVATVFRQETHRRNNGGVYLVVVNGSELPDLYRHVDEARAAAEQKLLQDI